LNSLPFGVIKEHHGIRRIGMGGQDRDELRDALQGYKAGITPGVKATLA